MPYKDKEKAKERQQKYYDKNKEKIKEQVKKYDQSEKGKEKTKERKQKYYEENKEKIKERQQKYMKENKEKIKERQLNYAQTEAGKKTNRIAMWKYIGVISDDWDALYEYYINCWECENCGVELIEGIYCNNKRVLDHCHKTRLFRNVLCSYCNVLRGE